MAEWEEMLERRLKGPLKTPRHAGVRFSELEGLRDDAPAAGGLPELRSRLQDCKRAQAEAEQRARELEEDIRALRSSAGTEAEVARLGRALDEAYEIISALERAYLSGELGAEFV